MTKTTNSPTPYSVFQGAVLYRIPHSGEHVKLDASGCVIDLNDRAEHIASLQARVAELEAEGARLAALAQVNRAAEVVGSVRIAELEGALQEALDTIEARLGQEGVDPRKSPFLARARSMLSKGNQS